MQPTAPPESQVDPVKPNTFAVQGESDEAITELARRLSPARPRRTSFSIPARLKQLMAFFQGCYEYFEDSTKAQVSTSPSAEWLLDNFYVVEQAVRQIEEDLPAAYYRRLPKTRDDHTRIYLIALANTQSQETRIDIDALRHFLEIFQEVTPLSTGELWALPLMLRLSVLETLAEALAAVTGRTLPPPPFDSPALRASASVASGSAQGGTKPDPDMTVANSVLSLRALGTQDWKAFFEAASMLEKTLRGDPAGLYPEMDFETRNRYRSVVEELANGSPMDEVGIARQAIQLARTAEAATAAADSRPAGRAHHIGYYLIAEGRERLEARINFRPTFSGAVVRFIQKHATLLYLGSIALLTLVFVSLIAFYAAQAGATFPQLITAALLSLSLEG